MIATANAKRIKQDVRDFLNLSTGLSLNAQTGIYRGQCVSLIKALFDFLGVPEPYRARGDAKDAANYYLKQGIADDGKGWLNVVVNKDMGLIEGVRYGHIWLDLAGEANFEQNGNRALITTKNTRPISQGQQFVNLDKWITGDKKMEVFSEAARTDINVILFGYDKGWFKGFVGGEYKTAIYAIKDSPEYRAEPFVNKGDLQNYTGRIHTLEE